MIDIKELLNEEKSLGKNPLVNFKVSTFENIDKELNSIKTDEKKLALRDSVLLLLDTTEKNSIPLNYIVGKIKLMLSNHESNVRLNNLALDLYSNRNWDAAKYVAETVLKANESAKALRILADVASEKGNEDEKWNYFERYVKADSEDKDVVIKVADHYEALGDKKNSMYFYQRALLRLEKSDEYDKLDATFTKLLQNGRTEYHFYSSFISRIQDRNSAFAITLYKKLLSALLTLKEEQKKDEKTAEFKNTLNNIIETSRSILILNKEDNDAKKVLSDVFAEKYGAMARFIECKKKHNVMTSIDPVKACDEFEKDIAYSKNTYVLQKAMRRVGKIEDIEGTQVKVRYSATDVQTVSLESAYSILVPLTNQNIKAIKKGVPAQKIKAKIMAPGGIEWLTRTLLYSSTDSISTLKEMKEEVVPSILDLTEWKDVSEKIKEEVKENPYIRIIPGSTDSFQLTAYPSTREEKQLYIFRSSRTFYEKVSAILDALEIKDIERNSDAFLEMVSYFKAAASDKTKSLDVQVSAILTLDYVAVKNVPVEAEVDFEDVYKTFREMDKKDVFVGIENTTIKKEYIDKIAECDKNAVDILISIFPKYVFNYIPNKIYKLDPKKYYQFITRSIDNFRDSIAAFIYFAIEVKLPEKTIKEAHLTKDRIFKTELMALSYLATATDNADNRKFRKQLEKELIDNKAIESYLLKAKREDIDDVKSLVLYNAGLETTEKNHYKDIILKRFPDYDLGDKTVTVKVQEIKAASGWLCTEASYRAKQDELKDIQQVQIPWILKEINTARELGDLRENSEYQYAKEHKRELDRRVGELTNELNTVRIMKNEDVLPGLVGFGTKVTLFDNLEEKEIIYTFLGRWESSPEEGIIDFNAPIGKALYNHKEGEKIDFQINGRDCSYTINKIEIIL